MPITTLINYLQHYYSIGSIHPQKEFNLYDRDPQGKNRHSYHIYVSFSPTNSTIFFSVYYEGNWETEYQDAKKRSNAIQHAMQNDSRWAGICDALNLNENWFGEWNQKKAHGDCKFTFANRNVPPNQNQLNEIKNLVDLIFANF